MRLTRIAAKLAHMDFSPQPNPWRTLDSRAIYDNPWIRVTEHDVLTPGGNPGLYGVVSFKNIAVAVIPVDEKEHTWLVGQFRYPTNSYSWEVPEGGAPEGETPEDCAHRELAEETGLRARKLHPLMEMELSNCVSDERAVAFIATGLTAGAAAPEDSEMLRVFRVPLTEAFAMAMDGRIRDALSVAPLLKLRALLDGRRVADVFPA